MDLRYWAINQLAGFIHREVSFLDPERDRASADWRAAEQCIDDRGFGELLRNAIQSQGSPSEDTLEAYDARYGQWFHDSWMSPLLSSGEFFADYLPSPPYGGLSRNPGRPRPQPEPIHAERWVKSKLARIISETVENPGGDDRRERDWFTAEWLLQRDENGISLATIIQPFIDDGSVITERQADRMFGRIVFECWQRSLRSLFEQAPLRSSYGRIRFG